MSHPPSTPVKVPPSAASYTAATLDPDLRSNINARLIIDGHVAKIQDHLLHALYANNANWPAALQDHALALLRSGEATTFPALLQRVLDDVRADTLAAGTTKPANGESAASASGGGGTPSAADGKKGAATGTVPAVNGAGAAATGAAHPLAVPRAVVDETLRVTRDCLEAVVDIDETAAS